MRIAVSDVDGTIVRGSLVLSHAAKLHESGAIDLGDRVSKWINDPKNEENIAPLAESYRESILGMSRDDLLIDEYIDTVVSNKMNFYSVLQRLVDFQSDGGEVVLISGSPSYLVEPFADNFGFKGVGSDYVFGPNGKLTGECIGMFSGEAKRDYLKLLGLDKYSEIFAYGDTQSDRPLFENAHYSVLVEPTEETHTALSEMVHEIILD